MGIRFHGKQFLQLDNKRGQEAGKWVVATCNFVGREAY